jgi:ATP-dependent Clp protease protease subunit
MMAAATGHSTEKINKDTDRDYWLTAQAAADYGVIDKVIE